MQFFCVRKFFAHLCGVVYGGVTINSRRHENGKNTTGRFDGAAGRSGGRGNCEGRMERINTAASEIGE